MLESDNLPPLADGSNKVFETQSDKQREQDIADLISDEPFMPNPPNPYLGRPGRPRGSEVKPKPYDGSTALPHAGHEEVARFMATPYARREHRSLAAFATKKLNISVSTIYVWVSRADVLKRASWLTEHCRALGDLVARREWPAIVEAQVDAALKGDTSAAKFCERRAWHEDGIGKAPEVSNPSLEDLLTESCGREEDAPTWFQEMHSRRNIQPKPFPEPSAETANEEIVTHLSRT